MKNEVPRRNITTDTLFLPSHLFLLSITTYAILSGGRTCTHWLKLRGVFQSLNQPPVALKVQPLKPRKDLPRDVKRNGLSKEGFGASVRSRKTLLNVNALVDKR
jgi:hypothetical protein